VATVGGLDFPDMSVSDACGPCPGDFSNTTESLNLALDASPGFGFDRIVITQGGQLNASAPGTDGAIATVLSSVFIDIFEIDGAPIDKISASAPMLFRPADDPEATPTEGFVFDASGDNPDTPGDLAWWGEIVIDLAGHPRDERGAGVGHARWNRLLDVSVVVCDGAGQVEGETGMLLVTPSVVPETGTALLTALGLAALAVRERRLGY